MGMMMKASKRNNKVRGKEEEDSMGTYEMMVYSINEGCVRA